MALFFGAACPDLLVAQFPKTNSIRSPATYELFNAHFRNSDSILIFFAAYGICVQSVLWQNSDFGLGLMVRRWPATSL